MMPIPTTLYLTNFGHTFQLDYDAETGAWHTSFFVEWLDLE